MPLVYFGYVDLTFCQFKNETEADLFFNSFNKIDPALKFTLDKETGYTLPFLDVFVHKTPLCYVTSIIS